MSVARTAREQGDVRRKTLLVVEDDPDIRETLAEILERRDYRVETAENGSVALDWLRIHTERPALILLDLMMPVMNGWQFRDQQRSDPRMACIPVLVVSAQGDPRAVADELGAVGGLKKPVELSQLLAAIEAAIGGS